MHIIFLLIFLQPKSLIHLDESKYIQVDTFLCEARLYAFYSCDSQTYEIDPFKNNLKSHYFL